MSLDPLIAVYGVPLIVIWIIYWVVRKRTETRSRALLQGSAEAGLLEPASLHPKIDPARCLGCGACVRACPEGDVLGLINGKSALVEPANCIGHGACKTACPTQAITLVFGTETRGVELPHVGPDFQTNVPGIFVAGELGGMGLIRNAIEQGRQAIDSICNLDGLGQPQVYDVIIVGSGPAGLSASLAAKQRNLRYLTLDQDSLGGTVAHFPRGKLVMTAPAVLPIVGEVNFREISKENLLEFWAEVLRKTSLKVQFGERVDAIEAADAGFSVVTNASRYRTRAVLLAIGRRGTPRTLDVPGEDFTKVVYRLIDPAQYRGQHVLIVGGGDSALEAAACVAEEPGTTVALSYRSDSFSRAKPKNRKRVEEAKKAGRLSVLLGSKVTNIAEDAVELQHSGRTLRLRNDAVIVCAGGILPTSFLRKIGVRIETKYGTA
jgi:thioredoxin reductase (NADPH)